MDNKTYVSLSAADALLGMLNEVHASTPATLDFLAHWCDVTVQAEASTVTVTTRAMSKEGLIGPYVGSLVMPYSKRSLNDLFPYPFVYEIDYPTTFVMLATHLNSRYGVLLEDGEFTLDGNTQTTALSNTDPLDAHPTALGEIVFRATAHSGRFVQGSTLTLRLTSPGQPAPLGTILALPTALDFHSLTDHA